LSAPRNSWDAGGAYPDSAKASKVPVSTAKKLNFKMQGKTDALNYDIALDEFNSAGAYVGTSGMFYLSRPVGSGSVSLAGLAYDGTRFIFCQDKYSYHCPLTRA